MKKKKKKVTDEQKLKTSKMIYPEKVRKVQAEAEAIPSPGELGFAVTLGYSSPGKEESASSC